MGSSAYECFYTLYLFVPADVASCTTRFCIMKFDEVGTTENASVEVGTTENGCDISSLKLTVRP